MDHTLDTEHAILYLRPTGPLAKADFVQLAAAVDPYIEQTRGLAVVIIEVSTFPGWESLAALISHFRFVRDHQQHIKKVALVTDSVLGTIGERLAAHFVSADIKHFAAGDGEATKQWVLASAHA